MSRILQNFLERFVRHGDLESRQRRALVFGSVTESAGRRDSLRGFGGGVASSARPGTRRRELFTDGRLIVTRARFSTC